MGISEEVEGKLQVFMQQSSFANKGAVITDLDGTAVHEYQGKIVIPKEVELGLMRHYERGRPLILNSLRFPLSVIRTFGQDWYKLSNAPIPTVTCNGSLMGYVKKTDEGELAFEEAAAFPLTRGEIVEALEGVRGLLDAGIKNILVFYYPRDWRIGEVIWTPVPENIIPVKEKYRSASSVTAIEFQKLQDQMLAEDICMIFLLIDAPEDQLMAYQHTKRSNFFTHKGVDKLFGAQTMADLLKCDMRDLYWTVCAAASPIDSMPTHNAASAAGALPSLLVYIVPFPFPSVRSNSGLKYERRIRECHCLHRRQELKITAA
jgi:hypothetical protein